MKKLAIIIALMIFGTQISAVAATKSNYNKKPAQKSQTKPVNQQVKKDPYKPDGSDYLLKYNINDLEAAPWLNGGNRKI